MQTQISDHKLTLTIDTLRCKSNVEINLSFLKYLVTPLSFQ